MIKIVFFIGIIVFLSWPLFSQSVDDIEGMIINNEGNNARPASIGELVDYNRANNIANGFSAHKQNYILPFTLSDNTEGRKKSEIKFQISVKQRLLKFYGWAIYFGYTQKSFWQAYNYHDSSPFRENNFNPEFFLRTKMWHGIRLDLGYEHESNGQPLETSRSWDRIYLTPYFENHRLMASFKGWFRLKEKEKKTEQDAGGDDNPDIQKYYGYGELWVTFKIPELKDIYISTISRYNFRHQKGGVEISITIPFITSSMKFMVQYWDGYGESLIDYNVNQRKIGIGLNFTR